jgi:hypothetical protein
MVPMKKLLIALLCGTWPTACQQLTERERAFAAEELQASRKVLLTAIAGLSPAQWNFKAAPDRWSVGECVEHIALAEDGYIALIEKLVKAAPNPALKAEAEGKDSKVLEIMSDRTATRTAPETLQPTRRWKDPAEALAHLNGSRDRLIAFVRTTPEDLRSHIQPHRATGPIDAYQWVLLASGHSRRHTAQIQEVKASPGFPGKQENRR